MTYTLTGTYVHGDGTGRTGSLRFAPTVAIAGDDQIVLPSPLTVELDADGSFSVALIGTDDVLYSPSGWLWTVTEMLDGGRAAWSFELTANADISDLSPAEVPGSYALYTLLSTFNDHSARHAQAGADALNVADLGSGAATLNQAPLADGSGGVAWGTIAAGGAVDSVNGQTGVVVLDNTDVGAAATSHAHTLADVSDAGGSAALDVGTTAGTVAAGDDARINGAVQASTYDANSILAATTDNTPAAVTVAEQRLVGRITGGNIDDLTPEQVNAVLSGASDVNTVAASGAAETLPATFEFHDVTMDQSCTFTFTSPASDGHAFVLRLAGAFTPTFPASVKWSGGVAPTYTTPAVYTFVTHNAGTTWNASQMGKAFA